jgi:hypothetical protein
MFDDESILGKRFAEWAHQNAVRLDDQDAWEKWWDCFQAGASAWQN